MTEFERACAAAMMYRSWRTRMEDLKKEVLDLILFGAADNVILERAHDLQGVHIKLEGLGLMLEGVEI